MAPRGRLPRAVVARQVSCYPLGFDVNGTPGKWTTKAPGFPAPETRVPGAGPLGVGGGGAVVRMGFDNSTEAVVYVGGSSVFVVLQKNLAGDPLQVPLTGYKPGNVVVVVFSVVGEDAVSSGPTSVAMTIRPTVDLGAGARVLDSPSITVSQPGGVLPPLTWQTFVVPVPAEVLADPVVGLQINSFGGDNVRIREFAALLTAYEVDAASVTQLPTTILDP